ncbi:unnamed protein product, partial [Closterium sp. NIES-54]
HGHPFSLLLLPTLLRPTHPPASRTPAFYSPSLPGFQSCEPNNPGFVGALAVLRVYGEVAIAGAAVFLVIQLVSIINFIYVWNNARLNNENML